MKKFLCILFALAFFGESAFAQIAGENLRLGFYISPGISSFRTQNNDINTSGGPSFGFGLIADIEISDNYSIGSGINLNYLKGDVSIIGGTDGTDGVTREGNYRYGYVEIPVTAKLSTNEVATSFGDLRFFGQLGGFLGLPLLRTRYDFFLDGVLQDEKDNAKANKLVNPINIGLASAVGGEYAMTENTYIYLALWYNVGFISVLKNKAFDEYNFDNKDNKVNSSLIGLRLGAMF